MLNAHEIAEHVAGVRAYLRKQGVRDHQAIAAYKGRGGVPRNGLRLKAARRKDAASDAAERFGATIGQALAGALQREGAAALAERLAAALDALDARQSDEDRALEAVADALERLDEGTVINLLMGRPAPAVDAALATGQQMAATKAAQPAPLQTPYQRAVAEIADSLPANFAPGMPYSPLAALAAPRKGGRR